MPDHPLRVAQLMLSASRKNAGVFVAASGLSRALDQRPDLSLEVFAGRDEYTEDDRTQWRDIPVHTFPMQPPVSFGFALGMAKAVRDFNPHILHQHGVWAYPSLITRKLSKKKRTRVLISVHGMLTPWALRHQAWKKRLALRLYEKRNLADADCIHALTVAEVDEMRNLGFRAPICLIPNGVEVVKTIRGRKKDTTGSRILLYVGRLHPIKGIEELLHGWAIYIKGVDGGGTQKWHLRIVGWGEDEFQNRVNVLVTELGVGESVEFVGAKFGDDLLAEYSGADAFVLTSHSEAMPMTILEAWANGLPVIMTPECGLPEGYDEGAAIKTSVAKQDIAAAISAVVLMSAKERHNMGRAGLKLVEERYSWQSVARSFTAVYDWLAGQGPKPDCVII